jgi:hypothetical protein
MTTCNRKISDDRANINKAPQPISATWAIYN